MQLYVFEQPSAFLFRIVQAGVYTTGKEVAFLVCRPPHFLFVFFLFAFTQVLHLPYQTNSNPEANKKKTGSRWVKTGSAVSRWGYRKKSTREQV